MSDETVRWGDSMVLRTSMSSLESSIRTVGNIPMAMIPAVSNHDTGMATGHRQCLGNKVFEDFVSRLGLVREQA